MWATVCAALFPTRLPVLELLLRLLARGRYARPARRLNACLAVVQLEIIVCRLDRTLSERRMHMSEPAENPTLDAFTRVAAWYFANPPTTWCVARYPSGWYLMAADGTFISSHGTKRDAVANLTDGSCAAAHYATLNWYLGYPGGAHLRPLTDAEREAVAKVLSSIAVATLIRRFERP
jgi:hypothetical protein